MPKPVLSDSLFNADDVATAILAEANLQVTNSELGVTDITSGFTRGSGWSAYAGSDLVVLFNGFVFYNLGASRTTTPSPNAIVWNISSDYRPNTQFRTTFVTHQLDSANFVYITTDGYFKLDSPSVQSGSDSTYRVVLNGWYRI